MALATVKEDGHPSALGGGVSPGQSQPGFPVMPAAFPPPATGTLFLWWLGGGGGTGNSSLAAWNLSDSAGVLPHQTHTEELEEDIILWEEAIMWFGAKIMQLGR